MKKLLLILSFISALCLTSCDNREDVEGQWQSDVVSLNIPGASTSTSTMVITFSLDGKVTINSDVNFTEPIAVSDDQLAPSHISVTATASIDGNWQYVKGENDEVDIIFDDSSLTVNVPTEGIHFATTQNSENSPMSFDELKQRAIANYTTSLTGVMKEFFYKFSRLEDIKVSKGDRPTLRFEVDRHNAPDELYTFTRI